MDEQREVRATHLFPTQGRAHVHVDMQAQITTFKHSPSTVCSTKCTYCVLDFVVYIPDPMGNNQMGNMLLLLLRVLCMRKGGECNASQQPQPTPANKIDRSPVLLVVWGCCQR